jgi:hypothetical protein
VSDAGIRNNSADADKIADAERVPRAGYEVFVPRTQEAPRATRLDIASSTLYYIGVALVGATPASATWQVRRLTFDGSGGVVIEWADGNTSYDNVWDNRASLSYS